MAALCHAQTYTISGVVKDSAGQGIIGATVRLGKINKSTKTVTDGKFTLTDKVTGITNSTGYSISVACCPIVLSDCRLSYAITERSVVKVIVYDINGRLLVSHREVASPGSHSLMLPRFAEGVHIYDVTIKDNHYAFKGITGKAADNGPTPASQGGTQARLTKTAAYIDDALLVTKEGYQLYRLAIKNPDTSGIRIALVPLVTGMVTDTEGNVYRTVKIGKQQWTAENLRTTKYNDNTSIPLVTDSLAWVSLTTPGYCFYNNSINADTNKKWGAMYNWYAVNTGKLAPKGWHVPNNAEWDTLKNYLIANGYGYEGTIGDTQITKAMAAATDWNTNSDTGVIGNDLSLNNSSGFSALPVGYRLYLGKGGFNGKGDNGLWWTTEGSELSGYLRDLYYNYKILYKTTFNKKCGISVRLVRD